MIERGVEVSDEQLFRALRRSAVHYCNVGSRRPGGGEDIFRSRQRRRQAVDADEASPSMNSCLPLVTLLRPFGERETICLASFRFLTARTIIRHFLGDL